MAAEVEEFFSTLHSEVMRPLGFSKSRHNFARPRDGYTEAFEFQGSSWNDASRPWRFYINVRVDFPDLGKRPAVRLNSVIAGAPKEFDYSLADGDALRQEIAGLVSQASDWIAANRSAVHEAFADKRYWVGIG